MLSLTPPWEPIKTVEMFKSVVYIAGESNFVGYRICIGLLRTTNPTHSPLFSGVLLLCLNHNFFFTHTTPHVDWLMMVMMITYFVQTIITAAWIKF